MAVPKLHQLNDIQSVMQDATFDALIVVAEQFDALPAELAQVVSATQEKDRRIGQSVQLIVTQHAPGGR